jgi:hypothetical protein
MPPAQDRLARFLVGLPDEIRNKIGKTKQTRGAQPYDRVVYQNRVNRNGLAVVPYAFRDRLHPDGFESGYVVMVRPEEYFSAPGRVRDDFDPTVVIGTDAFVYYDNRRNFNQFPPRAEWRARTRGGPGEMVLRLPATTATDQAAAADRVEGDPQGIRFFEYASTAELNATCIQLALLSWHTEGIDAHRTDAGTGVPAALLQEAERQGLWDTARLETLGVMLGGRTICPLCRQHIRASELMTRVEQAEGREVFDLTITEVNLFHMNDLKPGWYNHHRYSLGWGHHHCNAVARDRGLAPTVQWMAEVLRRNGYQVNDTDAAAALRQVARREGVEGIARAAFRR